MAAPALTPELVLPYLGELSTDIRAAVLLADDGSLAAEALPPEHGERLRDLTRDLFQRAETADDQPVGQVEVSTGDAAVYAVREGGWTVAVVTGRFALPALIFFDLRTALGALAPAGS